jgi:hypothetical protein
MSVDVAENVHMAEIHMDSTITIPPVGQLPETDDWIGQKVRATIIRASGTRSTPNRLAAAIGTEIEAAIAGLPNNPGVANLVRERGYDQAETLVKASFEADIAASLLGALGAFHMMAGLGVSPEDGLRQHLGQAREAEF